MQHTLPFVSMPKICVIGFFVLATFLGQRRERMKTCILGLYLDSESEVLPTQFFKKTRKPTLNFLMELINNIN